MGSTSTHFRDLSSSLLIHTEPFYGRSLFRDIFTYGTFHAYGKEFETVDRILGQDFCQQSMTYLFRVFRSDNVAIISMLHEVKRFPLLCASKRCNRNSKIKECLV